MGKSKKYIKNKFSTQELRKKLHGYENKAYHFNRRENLQEFKKALEFAPAGYVNGLGDKIESADLIVSGSIENEFLITVAFGRNDSFNGKSCYDVDFMNLISFGEDIDLHQWFHVKDKDGNRISHIISQDLITGSLELKDATYNTVLTGSTSFNSYDEYGREKPKYIDAHHELFKKIEK